VPNANRPILATHESPHDGRRSEGAPNIFLHGFLQKKAGEPQRRCEVVGERFCRYRLVLPVLIPKQLDLGSNKTRSAPFVALNVNRPL
jgi:hypothetical protein